MNLLFQKATTGSVLTFLHPWIQRLSTRLDKEQGLLKLMNGTGRGNRTPMMSPSRDFESRASTNSAIPARYLYCVFSRTTHKQNMQLSLKTYRTASYVGEQHYKQYNAPDENSGF
jgi:hypothetical protein